MTRIFIAGIAGKMGRAIIECARERDDFTVVGGFDVAECGYPVFGRAADVNVEFDVIVDFSRPELLGEIIALAERTDKPVVIATTGYNDEEVAKINKLSEKVAVLRSGNMSVGVNLLLSLVEQAATVLCDDFDVEIIEKHHNQKADAPSGTALMLAESVASVKSDARFLYGRHGLSKREKSDVTIHAVRGGTIVGEHDVIFAGNDEIVTLSHTALSRKVFAVGALKAAAFVATAEKGMYSMKDALGTACPRQR